MQDSEACLDCSTGLNRNLWSTLNVWTTSQCGRQLVAAAIADYRQSTQSLILKALDGGSDVPVVFSPIRREVSVELQHLNGKRDVRRILAEEPMTREQAKAKILSEWRALPATDRADEQKKAAFALKIEQKYKFRCSGDPYQHIMGWLKENSS